MISLSWYLWGFILLIFALLLALVIHQYLNQNKKFRRQKLWFENQNIARSSELNEANKALKEQHEELMQQHEEITSQNDKLSLLSEEILQKNAELEQHRSQLEVMVSDRTKELVEAKYKAEESDRLKSAFLANMSHEIRTPMNAIVGFANLLKDKDLSPEEQSEFIGIINSNSEVLLVLIDDILDLSLIEANQVVIRKEVLSLNEILDNVFSAFSLMNKKEELTIKLNNELHSLNLKINTDRVRLKQILTNLMNNAYKFTTKGTIELGMKMQNDNLAIYVKDTGIGISESDLPLIFERFRKSEVRQKTLYRGTGLGLAISKALSQLLGGELFVESRVDEGSVFSVVFPFSLTTREETVVKQVPLQADFKKWAGKNILIVEDEQANYLYVKKMLARTAVGIHWAENGLEAVKMVSAKQSFDLILMDIKMPVMDGYEATRIIKSNSPGQIVIALTAYARPEDRIQFIGAGFDDYLTKPIKPTDFMGVISRYIS